MKARPTKVLPASPLRDGEILQVEALVEDSSGSLILEPLLERLLAASPVPTTLRIHPHRGLGSWPSDERRVLSAGQLAAQERVAERGDPPEQLLGPSIRRYRGSGLYPYLEAKCQAYARLNERRPFLLVVVQDADDHSVRKLRQELEGTLRKAAPGLVSVLGIAVEELEAWMLADEVGFFRAFPGADRELYDRYIQDSICGTWELLAEILLGERRAREVIRRGYPYAGKLKTQWARVAAPYLRPERVDSPSFRRFAGELEAALARFDASSTLAEERGGRA